MKIKRTFSYKNIDHTNNGESMIYYIFTHNLERIMCTKQSELFVELDGRKVPLNSCLEINKPYGEYIVVRCTTLRGWGYALNKAQAL